MIVVDSSVWIDHLRGATSGQVVRLRQLVAQQQQTILVGDLILCEVLRGVRSAAESDHVEAALRAFPVVALCDPYVASKAAANYRVLRDRGTTIRSTVDLVIGTFCIEHDHALLHSDRDFEPMERYLGLRTV